MKTLNKCLGSLSALVFLVALAPCAPAAYVAGLHEGYLLGGSDVVTPNPCMSIVMFPVAGETTAFPPWESAITWVYSGQVYDSDGQFSFAGSMDDRLWIKIDGVVRLDAGLGSPQTTGLINYGMGPNGDGWHILEIRVSNTGGGAGPVSGAGWTESKGIGFNASGSSSTDGSDYVVPIDPGNMTLFRVDTVPEASTTLLVSSALAGGMAWAYRRKRV